MSFNIKKLTNNFKKNYVGGFESIAIKEAKETDGLLLSEETFSVIDLVSEGPIEGLVDRNGRVFKDGEKILNGVYLNDVPVRESSFQELSTLNYIILKNETSTTYNPDQLIQELAGYDTIFGNAITTLETDQKDFAAQIASLNQKFNLSIQNLLDENQLNSTPTIFNTSSQYVKYLLVDYSEFSNEWSNLNLTTNNNNVKIYFSGENGYGELTSRQIKNTNGGDVAINIPEPLINVALDFSKSNSSASDFIPNIKAGYFLLPLAIGDSININGSNEIVFNSVDPNCVDQVSRELQGAKILIVSETEQEESVFNFDKISVQALLGEENQPPILENRTSKSVGTNFKLNGLINSESFVDNTSAQFLSENINPYTVINNLINTNNFLYDGIYIGNSIYSQESLESVENAKNNSNIYAEQIEFQLNNVNYAEWARNSIGNLVENRDIFEHVIENSAVSDVSLIFTISQLYDTYVREKHAGSRVSAFLELGITVGLEGDQNPNDPDYEELILKRTTYLIAIEGLVQSSFRFKIGDGAFHSGGYIAIKAINSNIRYDANRNITLPASVKNRNRYVKVYRITPETYSSKRTIDISINAVNEHFPYNFRYPLSAIISSTISSKSFSQLPKRTFDLKLKKIKVPSNYNAIDSLGVDKRFVSNAKTYDGQNKIYDGEWDGTFRIAWSDNPAWIVYDLLTNPIYGIGSSLEEREDVNIWELYKIGRYADAVDENGFFVGVPDGYGGLEPRFSFNAIFNNEQEAYDMINSVAVSFRGSAFYNGSEIDFYYDRPDDIIAIFNNRNVKEGSFNYSDTLKSSRYTVVEVPYLDKRDNFLQKIEYFEDEEGIAKYGYVKKTFEGIGITSRGQARRFAKYALLSNKYETQSVGFVAKEEGMFLSPGDVIRIDDELKNIDTAEGFLLDIDTSTNKLITNYMDTGDFDTGIYVYKATDETGIRDIFENLSQVSLDVIDKTNTSKINFYDVSQYSLTGTDDGGEALVIELDSQNENLNELVDVKVGSFFSIPKTGRNENLFKVISVNDLNNGEFEITAQQSEQNKYALIDSGIQFTNEEAFFAEDNTVYDINLPDPPSNIVLSTGIVDSKFTITGAITRANGIPLADKFNVQLLDPSANIIGNKTINYAGTTTYTSFNNIQQYGGATYEMRAYSVTTTPYEAVSANYTSSTIEIPIIDEIDLYQKIRIANLIFTRGAEGKFTSEIFPGGLDSGDFKTYGKDMEFSLVLKDRFGYRIDTQDKMISHWDNPLVSIDLLDENGTVKKENFKFQTQSLSFLILENDFNTYYDGSFPRDFRIRIRVTGDSQSEENTGTCVFENGPSKITSWAASSKYDGISDGFNIYLDAEPKYLQDINKIDIHVGTANFDISTDNLLTTIRNPNSYLDYKSANLAAGEIYPYIRKNSLFSVHSIKDRLFKQGEEIIFVGRNLPTPLEENKFYEIILGKTIDSEFYFDADNGYYNTNTKSIGSASYGYEGNINQNYIELTRLDGEKTSDHVGGGVGLLQNESNSYVYIQQDAFFSGKLDGIKNQFSDGFDFPKAAIRVATSGNSNYPMQKEYENATFSVYINATLTTEKQTIFDFGSPTGGCIFFVEQSAPLSLDYNYTFRAITKDQNNGTGEMLELTGSFINAQLFGNGIPIKHFAISIDTTQRPAINKSIVRGYLYIDGEIKNFAEVSGWGINDHDHACAIGAMIGDSVGESVPDIGNYFTGSMMDMIMYKNYLDFRDIQRIFLGNYNEYNFQVSEGNKKILEIDPINVENAYSAYSTSKCFKIELKESIIDETDQSVDLSDTLAEIIPTTNQIIKDFSFENVEIKDETHNNLFNNPYYLTEIDFLSKKYVWTNRIYEDYKIRYLPNLDGSDITSYDKAGALVLYTPNNNEKINVTGIYTYETGGYKYARLFLDEEYLNLTEGLELKFPNYDSLILTGLDNLGITNTECQFLNYQNFENVSTNILLTGTNSNTGYENFTGWANIFQSSPALIQDTGEIVLNKQYQAIIDDSEEFYEGAYITPQIPLQTGEWYTASLFYKTDTNSESDMGWNFRLVLGNNNSQVQGAIVGITIFPSGNTLQEWKEPATRNVWENYFEYGDTGIIPSGSEGWKRAFFNFKPREIVYINSETNLEVDETLDRINAVQLYLERSDGAATTGSGIFALPQIELATGTNGNSPSTQQPTVWNSPEHPIAEIPVGENRGFNNYKQLNVFPYNQNINVNDSLQIQSSAVVQKSVEAAGLYTGQYAKAVTGYIGGPNGEEIEWEGNYKRYDNLFNSYISITGYYPFGRWILYEGLSLTGDGPVWGGWDIRAQYTGLEGTKGNIRIEDNFDWSNDTSEIEKFPPIQGKFEKFNSHQNFNLFEDAKYPLSQKVFNTTFEYLDFNIKIKPEDIWGEGLTIPTGINDPFVINYVSSNVDGASTLIQDLLAQVNQNTRDLSQIEDTIINTINSDYVLSTLQESILGEGEIIEGGEEEGGGQNEEVIQPEIWVSNEISNNEIISWNEASNNISSIFVDRTSKQFYPKIIITNPNQDPDIKIRFWTTPFTYPFQYGPSNPIELQIPWINLNEDENAVNNFDIEPDITLGTRTSEAINLQINEVPINYEIFMMLYDNSDRETIIDNIENGENEYYLGGTETEIDANTIIQSAGDLEDLVLSPDRDFRQIKIFAQAYREGNEDSQLGYTTRMVSFKLQF